MPKTSEAEARFIETGSPVTWMNRPQYEAASKIERFVAWMDSQVGAREFGGPNCGVDVKAYLKACGLPQGNPWCAALVTWCAKKAGIKIPEGPAAVASWARAKFNHHMTPARGRLFLWLSPKGTGHIGVCLGPAALGVFRTIEGNTNNEGGRDGDRCHKRTRTIWGIRRNAVWGFIELQEA